MKRLFLIIFLIIVAPKISFSQEVKKPAGNKYLFDPYTDAKKAITNALVVAQKNHSHVLVVVGGDWSFWSRRLWAYLLRHHQFSDTYELVPVNFSSVNRNEAVLTELHAPKNAGYPILIVLDEAGKTLIATDTDDFKLDQKDYNQDLLGAFMDKWLTGKPAK